MRNAFADRNAIENSMRRHGECLKCYQHEISEARTAALARYQAGRSKAYAIGIGKQRLEKIFRDRNPHDTSLIETARNLPPAS